MNFHEQLPLSTHPITLPVAGIGPKSQGSMLVVYLYILYIYIQETRKKETK